MVGSDRAGVAEPAVAEVELDAQALLALAPSPAMDRSAHEDGIADTSPRPVQPEGVSVRGAEASAQRSSARRWVAGSPAMLAASLLVVASASALVAALGANYWRPAPQPLPEAETFSSRSLEPSPFEPADPAAVGEGAPPVLFTNPFDESEVFEFAPGTTTEEARRAVADFLIQRAIQRQKGIEARASSRG